MILQFLLKEIFLSTLLTMKFRRTDLSLVFNFKNTHLVLRVFIFHFDLDKAGKEYFWVLTELDFVSNLYVRISIYVWKEKREKIMFSLRYKKTLIKKLKEQNFVFVVKKKNVLCVEILRLKTEKNQMNMVKKLIWMSVIFVSRAGISLILLGKMYIN